MEAVQVFVNVLTTLNKFFILTIIHDSLHIVYVDQPYIFYIPATTELR